MNESTRFSGLTKAQTEILSYWHDQRVGGGLPRRDQIDPGVLRSHLAAISIVEVQSDGDMQFRLVGSKLRQVLGCDLSGQRMSNLEGAAADMLSLGLASVLERLQPIGGLIERTRDRHAWLRLPLAVEGRAPLILCHDALLPKVSGTGPESAQSDTISRINQGLAA
ncbi:MAG: PAS domain-containing protein [Henriciella sp.]|nr:PAS domain-containing protein [Henriciella sp.]